MAGEGDSPAPQEVSDAFVAQYYTVLKRAPEQACKFYVEDSVVSRPGPDGALLSFKSMEAINEQILSADYKNAKFEIISIDSQNSVEKGVFVVVIGFLTDKDELRRKFSQSFYLAFREKVYFILNDILRYVCDESPELQGGNLNETAPTNPLTTDPEPADAQVQTELVRTIDISVDKNENGEETLNKSPVSNEKFAQPVTEATVSKTLPDTTKRSFASIVQSLAQNNAPFQVKASTVKPKLMAQPRAVVKPEAPAPAVESEKETDPKNIDEPGTSIFVGNLPMSATPAQVHEVFNKFGPIKQDGIQVRSYRHKGICFGFVAFESASSVQNLLQVAQASPIIIGNRTLALKEKLANYEGSKASGRNGGYKNRSGYANVDGFKRQSNFNRSHGYSRNGSEKRGDVSNRDGTQKVNQNGEDKVSQ